MSESFERFTVDCPRDKACLGLLSDGYPVIFRGSPEAVRLVDHLLGTSGELDLTVGPFGSYPDFQIVDA